MAPQTPQRSERPGGAVPLVDNPRAYGVGRLGADGEGADTGSL